MEPLSLPVRALECPICLEMVKNAVSCAGSGCHYTICEVHAAELKECPQCNSTPFKTVAEFALRRIMENLPFLCKFCKSPIRKGDLDVHQNNCTKRPRHCGAFGCEFSSCESDEALRHLIRSHGQTIWESYTEATASGTPRREERRKIVWKHNHSLYNTTVFTWYLVTHTSTRSITHTVYVWVILQFTACEYFYSIRSTYPVLAVV